MGWHRWLRRVQQQMMLTPAVATVNFKCSHFRKKDLMSGIKQEKTDQKMEESPFSEKMSRDESKTACPGKGARRRVLGRRMENKKQ